VVLICVPTPLKDHTPDLRVIERAGSSVAKGLRPGALVILESTTYPGTTEEILRPDEPGPTGEEVAHDRLIQLAKTPS
jgi:UDP-N-acetyl-D-mannosaminuronate dehydrogenase